MTNETSRTSGSAGKTQPGGPAPDFDWRHIWPGFGVAAAVTLLVGLPLMVALDNIWWLGWVGVAGLLVGATVAARRAESGELLNGAMIALLYFGVVAIGYLVGSALELLPDPLPGLAPDNSTFFFVWPLAQIAAGTFGSFVGGLGVRSAVGGTG